MTESNQLSPKQLESLVQFENIRIEYDQIREVKNDLRDFYEQAIRSSKGRGFSLYGESGTGKSCVAGDFVSELYSEDGQSPILYVEVPGQCTVKNLATAVLHALGDPLAGKGTRYDMEFRLPILVKERKIKLIIFDEFQHFMSSSCRQVKAESGNWLKSQINTLKFSFVFVGLPELNQIFQLNRQLKRRTFRWVEMRPFNWSSDEEIERSMILLSTFDDVLPFRKRSEFMQPMLAKWVIEANGGAIGYLTRHLYRATEIAFKENSRRLSKSHLHRAYAELGGPRETQSRNSDNSRIKTESLETSDVMQTRIYGKSAQDTSDLLLGR